MSVPSMISSCTKASRHWVNVTFPNVFPLSTGSWSDLNELNVVDVCKKRIQPSPRITNVGLPHLIASQTPQPIPKLSLEIINHDTIISRLPRPPLLFARNLLGQNLQLFLSLRRRLQRRLLQNTVQILVKAIEEEDEKLLRVVLIRVPELFSVFSDYFLQLQS